MGTFDRLLRHSGQYPDDFPLPAVVVEIPQLEDVVPGARSGHPGSVEELPDETAERTGSALAGHVAAL